MAVNPDLKNELLICFGCGSTAKVMTDSKDIERIDIVDISKDVVELSKVVYPDPEKNPVNDPKVRIHIEDGRFFILTNQKKYDLITAKPPPPKLNKVVNLYSQEYFQLIYDSLSDGGMVTYLLPVYQLETSETKSILKGFFNVFKDNTSL
jgi:spermidine synthase